MHRTPPCIPNPSDSARSDETSVLSVFSPFIVRNYTSVVVKTVQNCSLSSHLNLDLRLIVQNHVQQRAMDGNPAIVINEAQLAKLVHKKADARARRADHFRQGLLADLGDQRFR